MTLRWVPGWNGLTEPEAVSYVAAVEAADGQELEFGVARAINDFVLGCKTDGIWDAIKACCILAGARTTNGALVPLVGDAPTPYNFDLVGDTDYDRKTGLKGDGTTKYLDSNRANDVDPQDDSHLAVYATDVSGVNHAIGGGDPDQTSLYNGGYRSRSLAFQASNWQQGFTGISRSSASSFLYRDASFTGAATIASVGTDSLNYYVFAQGRVSATPSNYGDCRLSFYSIGEALDLALLDTRVSALITAIGAAIP